MPRKSGYKVILAIDLVGGISFQNKLPWKIPTDLKFFKRAISICPKNKRNAVLMGRKTFESAGGQPFPNKLNIVLTRNTELLSLKENTGFENLRYASSPSEALDMANSLSDINDVYICGGKSLYDEFLKRDDVTVYLTRVAQIVPTDVKVDFPWDRFEFTEISRTYEENGYTFDFNKLVPKIQVSNEDDQDENIENMSSITNIPLIDSSPCWVKKPNLNCLPNLVVRNHAEFQFLDLTNDVIANGVRTQNRTGVDTLTVIGRTMRYDLSHGFPLLTTKKVNIETVIKELLWFIRGSTDGKLLLDQGVRIWEANGTREYLDSRGHSHRQENDLGPLYGFQWRHWGAKYKTCHDDYTNQGIDQLQGCIDAIRNDPGSRRIICSGWNVADLDEMALPPCHCLFHFHPVGDKLNLLLYQRSCDIGLGVPFNIASYSVMLLMVAKITNLKPGEFVHVLGNAHIYVNHIKSMKIQTSRTPRPFPTLKIKGDQKELDDFKLEDFTLEGYNPHPFIKMDLAV